MKKAINEFNKAFENRTRLGIMSALMVNEFIDFNSMKELLDLTDGNLAGHSRALEEAGYIRVEKIFVGRKPNTRFYITDLGRKAFEKHLVALEKIVKSIL
ncbi:MAG: transcriptional regulator [Lewinellaceae bacterium]|nr:transcriptional regulator [Saprospiraceae bacterium]MCB9343779.1 transcriptional regulator [Lewinellaceae bacterium]